jgi:hypothetical protein
MCLSFCVSGLLIPAFFASVLLYGQAGVEKGRPPTVSVPFVGCDSDGQVGPIKAPAAPALSVLAKPEEAEKLAYYKSEKGVGALAPRGWYCFGTYGSGGDALYITPRSIDRANIFSNGPGGADGPAIAVVYRYGGTSGRFSVAEVVARVFPVRRSFAVGVMEEFDQSFTFGPYPKDTLVYKSNELVEYQTPAQTDGLGTYWWLSKSTIPIEGAALLVGSEPDLALLSVRLPVDLDRLTMIIVNQFERDAARCPCD